MSRMITVSVVNKDGYWLSGYSVKTYGGSIVKTDKNGRANITAEGSEVTIYVNGFQEYKGSTARCENPLVVVK